VNAPRQCSLKLNGVSTTILAEGFDGEVNVNSTSGEITLRDLTGSVGIHTIGGVAEGIRINRLLGLDMLSGDIKIMKSALSSINANSVRGNMRIYTSLTDCPCDFKSVSSDAA